MKSGNKICPSSVKDNMANNQENCHGCSTVSLGNTCRDNFAGMYAETS
jgi:hypothetical protein